jgi:hypothetical protein
MEIDMPKKAYIVMFSISLLAWMPTNVLSQEHKGNSSEDFYLKCAGTEVRLYNDKTSETARVETYYHVSKGNLYALRGEVRVPEWVDECSGKSNCVINNDKIEFGGDEKVGEEANSLSINRLTRIFFSRSTSNEKSNSRIAVSWSAHGKCTKVANPMPKKF